MGQCQDDIKIPFPVVHSILIVETWLQFTQYDTVQAMTEDKMEYCRSLMAELILHEIKTHVRKCLKLHYVTINLVPSLAIKD